MASNFQQGPDIVIENPHFKLTVGSDCIVKSLLHKATGEECLAFNDAVSLFSVTQDRPFNNEIKLAHPNKKTTFQGNRLRREGDRLIVGFELIHYEAEIAVQETPWYVTFTLSDFILDPEDGMNDLCMDKPPVTELRLIQLPVCNRENFGEWLNVNWDNKVAVNVLANSPYAIIDAERRTGYRMMTADAVKGIKLKGCGAALITCAPDQLLDAIAALEEDFDLPRGVESRRSDKINASIYCPMPVTPENVDEHITYAKQGGFRMMMLGHNCVFKESAAYSYHGDYDYRAEYPNGTEDVKKMLDKIRAAGITPGLHFLHTYVGCLTRYISPVADHRLHLTHHFTLAKPLTTEDTTVYVEQNPEGMVMDERCRVLQFGGELIHYTAYTTEYPYCFTGCVRGHWKTNVTEHALGTIGGILHVSEYSSFGQFSSTSAYLDQDSSLQDEVAEKIAEAYNAGFGFVYYDGSEGTNNPAAFHIPNAQYRVYKKFKNPPVFCSGAAKAHFSWHMLSGGNAFDIFPMDIFKEKIAQYPAEEAPRMSKDFTRLDFGWWEYNDETQPDIYEYGTSRGAAWDCPVSVQFHLKHFKSNPRTPDILEVLRRWEDVRAKNWLTADQKKDLQNLKQEHILLINEQGEYELVPYYQIFTASKEVSAFFFSRKEQNYVVFWHTTGEGKLRLALDAASVCLEKELGGEQLSVEACAGGVTVPVAGRAYLRTSLTREQLQNAFASAQLVY